MQPYFRWKVDISDLGNIITLPHRCSGTGPAPSTNGGAFFLGLASYRDELRELAQHPADAIATANIGCQPHLQSASAKPVRHWTALLRATGT